ncbi:MAG: LytTR family transcriptional regulator [Novosphingobium sp.]|nr:LytTR family transcriptional regulator [Novosphingobium sp.]
MAAVGALMALAGAFGTGAMPPLQRSAFWLLLMGWNTFKWQMWFAWLVTRQEDWPRTALIGAVLLNLPLPLEIAAALRLVGIEAALEPRTIWAEALLIATGTAATIAVWRRRPHRPAPAALEVPLLARWGIAPGQVLAVRAEDHYCRIHLAGGIQRLLLVRFSDVLEALSGEDGERTHRGAWIAARAVHRAERAGRRWRLLLPCGTALPVSPSYRAAAAARGWLH